jgi:hypothetical protein
VVSGAPVAAALVVVADEPAWARQELARSYVGFSSLLHSSLRAPSQDVETRREPKSVTAAPVHHQRHPFELLVSSHTEGHQQHPIRRKPMRRLDRDDFVDVTLRRHNEFEPGTEFSEGLDGLAV